ncbi:tRNA(Ile)-lysidine synthase [Alphaproteobacteria bacterium SO-S41]|nr:tRNA(Ile)-lysidine synthase [Alphaproteobacteria bacterium SO-S41]
MRQVEAAFADALAVLDPPGPLALAVSGGPDSTALMHLAAGLKPVVFTVDHGLRDASAGEAAEVGAWAARLGLVHETLRWEGEKPVAGLQNAARAARYRLLSAAALRHGAAALLTGHTLDDQVETVAMRRGKGSGAIGLAGMASQVRLPGSEARLVRPLLGVRKAALVAYLDELGQAYVTDPSNANLRFDRARLRAAGVEDIPVEAIAAAQGVRLRLERAALAFLESAAVLDGAHFILANRGALVALEAELADVVLTALLRRAGWGDHPGTRGERDRVLEAIRVDGPFAGRTLAGCIIRRASRAESGGNGDFLAFAPERLGQTPAVGWWLPFAQFPQIGPDGRSLTET